MLPLLLCVPLMPVPTPSLAQEDDSRHATLQTWEEDLWLLLLDRNDSYGGRFSEHGILKRFNRLIDLKYLLDLFSSRFTLTESYRWHQRNNGVRWRATSVTKLDMAAFTEFKAEVGVGERWAIGARLDQVTTPLFDGGPFRVRFSRRFGEKTTVFSGFHIDTHDKTASDWWLGAHWTHGPARLTAQLTVFDVMNDYIFVTVDAASQAQIDSTVVYERQPVAIRTSGDLALSNEVRVEAYGAVVFPSEVVAYEEKDRPTGFTLEESCGTPGRSLSGPTHHRFSWPASPPA